MTQVYAKVTTQMWTVTWPTDDPTVRFGQSSEQILLGERVPVPLAHYVKSQSINYNDPAGGLYIYEDIRDGGIVRGSLSTNFWTNPNLIGGWSISTEEIQGVVVSAKIVDYTFDISKTQGVTQITANGANLHQSTVPVAYVDHLDSEGRPVFVARPITVYYPTHYWISYDIKLAPIFDEKSNEVDFNSLTEAQKAVFDEAASKEDGNGVYHADGGNDRVHLPNHLDIAKDTTWNRSKVFHGGNGADTIYGGDLDDRISGDGDSDNLYGGRGLDVIHGENGDDKIFGEIGNDALRGGRQNDTIDGGSGDDIIYGIDAADDAEEDGINHITGGAGKDKVVYSGHYRDYEKNLDMSFEEFFLGKPGKFYVKYKESIDYFDDAIEHFEFAGKPISGVDLQSAAGFRWAMESVNKFIEWALKFAPLTGTKVPKQAVDAVAWITNTREILVRLIEYRASPEAGRDIFIDSQLLLVKALKEYVNLRLPESSLLLDPLWNDLARRVERDAGKTYDILVKEDVPTLDDIKGAVREIWREIIGSADQYDDMESKYPSKNYIPIKQPFKNLEGTSGPDQVDLTLSSNTLYEDFSSIYLSGGGNDKVRGTTKNDMINGGDGDDQIYANAGNDYLDGGTGRDLLGGSAGNDTYRVDNARDVVIEKAGEGLDTLITSVSYALAAGVSIEALSLADLKGNANLNLTGNEGAQVITGNSGKNTLDGKGGADSLIGGKGNDTYIVDNSADRVFEVKGQGRDTVIASSSYTLAAGQEIETLQFAAATGSKSLNLTGNEFANALIGSNGANALDGKLGADVLTGKAGGDTFLFSTKLGSGNVDRIADFAPEDTVRLSKAIFTELAVGQLKANEFKDIAKAGRDADDHILYDSRNGKLFYDADGSGKGAAVQFAVLDNKAAITHADFLIA